MKWIDKHWSKVTPLVKIKNIATLLAIITFMIIFTSETIRDQSTVTVLNYTLDKLLILFAGLTTIAYAIFYQKQHDEDVQSQIEPSNSSDEVYIPKISTLITCSHNLDKVRSNLRTGVIFIFGIGVALLAGIQNYGSIFGDIQPFLFIGSGGLVLCTLVAILFSFSNPIVRLGLGNIGEGLVSTDLTRDEYQDTLISIINEKESHLGRMRTVMQLGIMMLLLSGAMSLMSVFFNQTLPNVSDLSVLAVLSFLNLLSTMSLVLGIFFAIIIIFGRAVIGLTE